MFVVFLINQKDYEHQLKPEELKNKVMKYVLTNPWFD
jgi:hypothetical protein